MEQNQINQELWKICQNFVEKTNIKNDYIEYIAALIYIKYYNNEYFEKIYENREDFYITTQIDEIIQTIQKEISDPDLFSNIKFKNIVFYRALGERNILSTIINDCNNLANQIKEGEKIAEAFDYILKEAVIRNDISRGIGEFYTPKAITELMTGLIIEKQNADVYDPVCGSGNFLENAAKQFDANIYGQEKNVEYYNICKTKMLLNSIYKEQIIFKNEKLDIEQKSYDYIFCNPPFSEKNWSENIEDKSIFKEYGLSETAVGDYAYVLKMLNNLKENGKMAVILPHGVLFRESEKQVRKTLVEKNNIETIIGLPENLFYQTRVSVVILVLVKKREQSDILFIDASNEYTSDKKNNILIQDGIKQIYKNRKDYEGYAHLAISEEVKNNDYNLTIKKYIPKKKEKKSVEKQKILKRLRDLENEKDILEQNINDVLKALGVSQMEEKAENKEVVKKKQKLIEKDDYSIDYRKIGNKLKEARYNKRYTQEQIAEKLEISVRYVSVIERGMIGIRLETLAKFCNVLDITIEELLK